MNIEKNKYLLVHRGTSKISVYRYFLDRIKPIVEYRKCLVAVSQPEFADESLQLANDLMLNSPIVLTFSKETPCGEIHRSLKDLDRDAEVIIFIGDKDMAESLISFYFQKDAFKTHPDSSPLNMIEEGQTAIIDLETETCSVLLPSIHGYSVTEQLLRVATNKRYRR